MSKLVSNNNKKRVQRGGGGCVAYLTDAPAAGPVMHIDIIKAAQDYITVLNTLLQNTRSVRELLNNYINNLIPDAFKILNDHFTNVQAEVSLANKSPTICGIFHVIKNKNFEISANSIILTKKQTEIDELCIDINKNMTENGTNMTDLITANVNLIEKTLYNVCLLITKILFNCVNICSLCISIGSVYCISCMLIKEKLDGQVEAIHKNKEINKVNDDNIKMISWLRANSNINCKLPMRPEQTADLKSHVLLEYHSTFTSNTNEAYRNAIYVMAIHFKEIVSITKMLFTYGVTYVDAIDKVLYNDAIKALFDTPTRNSIDVKINTNDSAMCRDIIGNIFDILDLGLVNRTQTLYGSLNTMLISLNGAKAALELISEHELLVGGARRHKKLLSLKRNKLQSRNKQNNNSRTKHNTQKRKKHNKQK